MIKQVECAMHITFACEAIGKSFQETRNLFQCHKTTVIDKCGKNITTRFLEVEFNSATLTCLFNQNETCKCAYLFLNDIFDITSYIEFCNKTYQCSFTLKGWVINNCLILISTKNKKYSLLIIPIIKQI